MSKATILAELYKKSVQEYTRTPAEWKDLLSCVARFYKRSFDNAVLIYAQKPDATQMATFDEWHDPRISRSINKGAKSIAVIDMSNPNASIKYLFDIMDTNGTPQSFKNVLSYHWELEDQYKPSLLIKFHEKYGTPTSDMERCLYKLVQRQVREKMPQYMANFKVQDENSVLYDLPIEAVKAEFIDLVTDSVAYMVFQKCGLSAKIFEENAFQNIGNFNSLDLFVAMGNCTVSLARPILKEINQQIEAIKIERSQVYENKTINDTQLHRGRGRDDVSQSANLGEQGNGQRPGGQIREAVEKLHDGEPPASPVGAGDAGQSQRNDIVGGRGSGAPQGGTDTGASHGTADARNREPAGESRSHENADPRSGGNHNQRSGVESQITPPPTNAEPPTDGKKPSVGGFFVVPPKAAEVLPEVLPVAAPSMNRLTEEEISDLVDVVLCADDVTEESLEAISEIHDFFIEEGHKLTTKANILQAFYSKLDTDYTTKTGEPLHITAVVGGLDFQVEEQTYSFTYKELAQKIDQLILMGAYPFSSHDSMLSDYDIPDEVEQMQGTYDEEMETTEEIHTNSNTPIATTKQEILDGIFGKDGTYTGAKGRIYKAMISMPAKKDRVAVLKNEYGTGGSHGSLENGGHIDIDYDGKGIHIVYQHDDIKIDEHFTWGAVESRIFELVKQGKYLTAEEIAELDNAPVSAPVSDVMDEGNDGEDEYPALVPFTAVTPTAEPSAPIFKTQPPIEQLNLFQVFPTAADTYEADSGESDGIITAADAEKNPLPFAVGDRIQYNGGAYEIIEFLHGDRTVKIGDISQLQGLNGFKITERVPLSVIADCKVLQADYTTGEIANMVVTAVQSGDTSQETKDAIAAAQMVSTANQEHDNAIMFDFMDRAHGEGLNYRYSPDHHLYDGGPKTKCANNIAAIRLLKDLQAQGRPATGEEQITLAKFVGWGGLANALTPGKAGWESQYEEIKTLLTEEEFDAAQQSTTTAYYTEQGVITHIYDALAKFGFHGGNLLDPAMATGNFFSVLPDSMKDSKLYGVEIEPISGAIARQLYPYASIEVKGFEATNHSDHFFDAAIGNIPFNSIRISDSRYDRYNFKIHDYFIAKTLDKVRPGGIVVFITSKYTLDKANPTIRKYIAQRAELMGAIRLPNNAFKAVAGTEATTDILFLQKREREIVPTEEDCPWLSVEENEDGVPVNSYFLDHPEMVLGKMVFDESMFGNDKTTACRPIPGDDLDERLERAVSYLEGEYHEATSEFTDGKEARPESIPADPNVRNFTYTVADDDLYFRENSRMYKQEITGRKSERIRGMVEIATAVRNLIDFQNDPYNAGQDLPTGEYYAELQKHLDHLNHVYDGFVKEYGAINSYGNIIAFTRDANAPLIRSIERESKTQKGVWEKTAMFYKATVRPKNMPSAVFSAEEALKVSLNVKGRVDLAYMSWLYQTPEHRKATPDEIIAELGDKIYQDPDEYVGNPHTGWVTEGEYLSGHVKDKLTSAILKAEEYPELFSRNVAALKEVQPTPLTPQEISFTLGTTWIPTEIYQRFMWDTFKTDKYNQSGRNAIALEFSKYSGAYYISSKSGERNSVMVNQTYGTGRLNAYEILESTLNLRSVEVKDPVDYIDPNTGEEKTKYVLNKKETILAREKQAEIKMAFESWLFAEPDRGAQLTKLYNDKFNNIRPRVYDGSDLILPDMSEDIKLRTHQRDVVAHGLYGDGNLLMAHEVGAGKTYAAIVLAYEMKRLGKVHKPLFAVPNHLVGQWASAYMEIYPNANILVAEKKDFERKNRRRFVSRIATGDYDAIIMAHSSFELIGLSRERQLAVMKTEIAAITAAIAEQKFRDGKDWSLKQMKIFQSNLQFRYDKLFNADKKDDTINFEELGVDTLIVDEAHAYKNSAKRCA